MGQLLLPIVFYNAPWPFHLRNLYLIMWVLSLIFIYPKVLVSKALISVYLFAVYYIILIYAGVFQINSEWNLLGEISPLFYSLLLFNYFIISKDYNGLKLLLLISMVFIFITLTTSLIGLYQHPSASRDLAGTLLVRGDATLVAKYRSMGIATYDFFYGLAFAFPVFVAFLKSHTINNKIKLRLLSFMLFAFIGLVQAQFVTAFLFAIIGTGLSFLNINKIKPLVFSLIVLFGMIVLMPTNFLSDVLLYISQIFSEGYIQDRLIELSFIVGDGFEAYETHIGRRADRIPYQLSQFYTSPFLGGGESLEHNYWLDRLAMFGLLGILPWVLVIAHQIKSNLMRISPNEHSYYIIIMLLFIAMGFIKNMGQTLVQVFIFFIIPALLIIKGEMETQHRNKHNA